MFGNRKNNLPPRPHPPLAEQVLDDLRNADNNDVVFKFIIKDEPGGEGLHFPMNTNDPEAVYRKVRTYLDVNQQLKELSTSLQKESESLRSSDEEMRRLAQDIRRQAQEALVK